MPDRVKISFNEDGTLELDISRLDEDLLRRLLEDGQFKGEGNTVKVKSLRSYPWPSPAPVDADCLCPGGPRPGDPNTTRPRLNILCLCACGELTDIRRDPDDSSNR